MTNELTWHIGGLLNFIQSTFVGLLRVLSVPIVLMLSLASGYTTYYGLSFFITDWIALIVTVAVQSIVVICSLELAGMHWRANPARFISVVLSLCVALAVSVSFSYFKFYEFSQKDTVSSKRETELNQMMGKYIEQAAELRSQVMAGQKAKVESLSDETNRAYMGTHPAVNHQEVGKGKVWSYYNELLQSETEKLKTLEAQSQSLSEHITQTRNALTKTTSQPADQGTYDQLLESLLALQSEADQIATTHGLTPLKSPRVPSYSEFTRGLTPSFEMWADVSWFALACAAMVDFFTLILSYRLEMTAPGPLTDQEKDLAFEGLSQFNDFVINSNDELEFRIERSELERARRISDWKRMFAVALLLNRGYLRKISDKTVEFAPNLYPIIARRLAKDSVINPDQNASNESALAQAMKERFHG